MSKPVLAIALSLLVLVAYANSLGNGFVWDDPIILTRQLPVFRTATSVLFPPANIPQFAPDYYRPIVIASYLVDEGLGGGEPWWFHLTVVLAHVLATIAVFAVGTLVFARGGGLAASEALRAAALGAALFAVHPVHTEAVAWVAGRADVFACLFCLVAVYAHLRSGSQPRFALLAGVALLLALLSKEVSISLALLLPLSDVLLPEAATIAEPRAARAQRRRAVAAEPSRPGWVLRYLPLAAAAGLYACLRLWAIGSGLSTRSGQVEGFLPTKMLAAIGLYLGRLVEPVQLNAYIAELPDGPLFLVASACGTALIAAAIVIAWRRGAAAIAFLLLWMVITLAPALSILVKISEVPVAERYLYLPSVGFCLLVGYGAAAALASQARLLRAATAVVTVLVLAGCTVATVVRNRVWSTDLALWTDAVPKSPGAGMPLRGLGAALLALSKVDEAERAYEEALRRFNTEGGRITILTNLGTIALTRGSLDRAEELYRGAVAVQATPDAVYNLGVVLLRRAEAAGAGDERKQRGAAALAEFERAESYSPHDPDIQVAMGQTLLLLDRRAEARTHLQGALKLGLRPESASQVRALLAQP